MTLRVIPPFLLFFHEWYCTSACLSVDLSLFLSYTPFLTSPFCQLDVLVLSSSWEIQLYMRLCPSVRVSVYLSVSVQPSMGPSGSSQKNANSSQFATVIRQVSALFSDFLFFFLSSFFGVHLGERPLTAPTTAEVFWPWFYLCFLIKYSLPKKSIWYSINPLLANQCY